MRDLGRFHRFACAVLVVTLFVIAWGGYVRATGAGAGCGNHWPTCNGQIVPRSPGSKTVIEFTHRLTSGLSFLMVVAQLVWAWRLAPRRPAIRRMATLVFVLMIVEALVGAGLVIFEMVAGNTAIARAYWMAAHLLNTFALLAAMALVIDRSARARTPSSPAADAAPAPTSLGAPAVRALVVGLAGVVLVAMSGAIVALGDTLFPARSLAEGMAQDLSPTAHLFVRLRVVHPVLALSIGIYLLVVTALVAGKDGGLGPVRRRATWAGGFVLLQLAVGFTNLALLAPVPVQLVHLLLADLVWLSLVALTAAVVAAARDRRPAGGAAALKLSADDPRAIPAA